MTGGVGGRLDGAGCSVVIWVAPVPNMTPPWSALVGGVATPPIWSLSREQGGSRVPARSSQVARAEFEPRPFPLVPPTVLPPTGLLRVAGSADRTQAPGGGRAASTRSTRGRLLGVRTGAGGPVCPSCSPGSMPRAQLRRPAGCPRHPRLACWLLLSAALGGGLPWSLSPGSPIAGAGQPRPESGPVPRRLPRRPR